MLPDPHGGSQEGANLARTPARYGEVELRAAAVSGADLALLFLFDGLRDV